MELGIKAIVYMQACRIECEYPTTKIKAHLIKKNHQDVSKKLYVISQVSYKS